MNELLSLILRREHIIRFYDILIILIVKVVIEQCEKYSALTFEVHDGGHMQPYNIYSDLDHFRQKLVESMRAYIVTRVYDYHDCVDIHQEEEVDPAKDSSYTPEKLANYSVYV